MRWLFATVLIILNQLTLQADDPSKLLSLKTLKFLPHVQSVKVTPAKIKRKRQIIHVLNWHYVEREPFVAEIRQEAKKAGVTLSDDDIEQNWNGFLSEVESVQAEQMRLLRSLAKSHQIKRVFIEGLIQEEVERFEGLSVKVAEHRPRKSDTPLAQLLAEIHRENKLLIGAAGQLLGKGELEKVLPADNKKRLEAANPVKEDGQVKFDIGANERREDAIVRNLLAAGLPVKVLVLGGAHDLADNLKQSGHEDVEYVRVELKAYHIALSKGK